MRQGGRPLRGGGEADLHRPLVRRLAGVLFGRQASRSGCARRCWSTPASAARRPSEQEEQWMEEAAKSGAPMQRGPPQPHAAEPGLRDAGRGADPLPLHAAAGARQPLRGRLHRPPLAEARADAGRLGRRLDLEVRPVPVGQARPQRHAGRSTRQACARRWCRSSATARRSCSAARWPAGRFPAGRRARRSRSRIPSTTSWSTSRWRWWRVRCVLCWPSGRLERAPRVRVAPAHVHATPISEETLPSMTEAVHEYHSRRPGHHRAAGHLHACSAR